MIFLFAYLFIGIFVSLYYTKILLKETVRGLKNMKVSSFKIKLVYLIVYLIFIALYPVPVIEDIIKSIKRERGIK